MTSLAVSLSVDQRGPCGIYLITDSRITWDSDLVRWDAGQKAFACRRTPDIFGYCGDAFFPPAILRQLIDQVDSGLLFADSLSAEDRHTVLFEAFRQALDRRVNAPMRSFSFFHGARDGEFMTSRFRLWETQYNAKNGEWTDNEHRIASDQSYLVHLDGSGKPIIKAKSRDWIGTEAEGTSRAAIWSFCDALQSGKDPFSGGPPQLVGIWRKGPAQSFGMLWHGKRYLAGLEVFSDPIWMTVPWFNHLFERCDGRTRSRLKSAQRHRKPAPKN
jgi:hypothetical protein